MRLLRRHAADAFRSAALPSPDGWRRIARGLSVAGVRRGRKFPEPTINYMKSRGMVGKYSQFTFAGASLGVVAPAFKTWAPAFWDNLAASIQLHHIPKVIAMNHRDCGAAKIAYGAEKVANPQIETETHKAALMEFRKQVGERQLGLMALDGKVEMFG
jgi:carbonic anhydrase